MGLRKVVVMVVEVVVVVVTGGSYSATLGGGSWLFIMILAEQKFAAGFLTGDRRASLFRLS